MLSLQRTHEGPILPCKTESIGPGMDKSSECNIWVMGNTQAEMVQEVSHMRQTAEQCGKVKVLVKAVKAVNPEDRVGPSKKENIYMECPTYMEFSYSMGLIDTGLKHPSKCYSRALGEYEVCRSAALYHTICTNAIDG